MKGCRLCYLWIDESSFNSAALPLYSWMQNGWEAERVIRPTCKRYDNLQHNGTKNAILWLKVNH